MNCKQIDLQSNEQNETSALFITNGSEPAGSTVEIDCLFDISESIVLISNSCGLCSTEKLICVLQSEDFGTQEFPTKIKNVVDWIALPSSEEQVSLRRQGFERTELHDSDAGNSKAGLFQNHIKPDLRGEIKYGKQDESFRFRLEQGVQQQMVEKN